MKKLSPRFVIALAALITTVFLAQVFDPSYPVLRPVDQATSWIRNEDPQLHSYFRKTVFINKNTERAWIAVSAKDGFELIVNGNTAGRFFYWRPTRPFQNGLSSAGQKLTHSSPALSLNYPREYQWTGHKSYLHPIYFDLGPFLKKGKNTLAIKVESRGKKTSLFTTGQVVLTTGEKLALDSDSSWKSSNLPEKKENLHWSDPNYSDDDWSQSIEFLQTETLFNQFNPEIFQLPFTGQKLASSSNRKADGIWFETQWEIDSNASDAWIRIYSNRYYSAEINGQPLRVVASKPRGENQGEWILGNRRVKDLPSLPELLDPDETGEYFGGEKFLLAPHSDPTLNHFNPFASVQNRDGNSQEVVDSDPYRADKKGGGLAKEPFNPLSYRPQRLNPTSLATNHNYSSFTAYNIGKLLRTGKNRLRFRLNNPTNRNIQPFLAVDGRAYSGENYQISSVLTDSSWKAFGQTALGEELEKEQVFVSPVRPANLPELKFQGHAWSWTGWISSRIIILTFSFIFLNTCHFLCGNRKLEKYSVRFTLSGYLYILVLFLFLMLRTAFYERHEITFFFQPSSWAASIILALFIGIITFLRLGKREDFLTGLFLGIKLWLNKNSKLVLNSALGIILILSAILRSYRLDFQPLDDDEYASTQAVLSIASSWLPGLSEGVFYTRSPLYHYLTGGVVSLFGENIWSLRLPAVIFGVLTGYLIYKICQELLDSPAIGLATLLLYTIHPFAIYSSHIARFYQQQQFFYLLTAYCFIKGFVLGSSQRYAYLTLFSFLLAVLSQEISIILGVQMLLAYIIFAQNRSALDNIRLVIAAFSVLTLIAINIMVFKTATLTTLSGVSPNIEATIALNFSAPMNYFSLFIGYSRLHVLLSLFFVLGTVFCLRKRNLAVLSLSFFTLSGVLLVNLLVTGVSLRYQYPLLPLFLILSVYGVRECSEVTAEILSSSADLTNRHSWLPHLSFSLVFLTLALSFSPWRIPGSYQEKILGDSSGALQYVKSKLQPGDKVAITEPHPHAALIELGQADYDLAIPLLYDFAYMKDGVLVDRNAGARVVSNISMLQEIVSQHDRLWVLVNREKFRSRGKNIRWEYPGARAELFLRENFKIKYETYLWTVFLWDVNDGEFTPFNRL